MNRSTCLNLNVVTPNMNPGSALHASQDLSFEMAENHAHEKVLISAWEAAINDLSKLWPSNVAPTDNDEVPVEHESRHIENRHKNEGDVITRDVKSAIKELVMNELLKMAEEPLDDIQKKSLHDAQSGIQWVVHCVVEQVMLVLLRKELIEETLEAHKVKFSTSM